MFSCKECNVSIKFNKSRLCRKCYQNAWSKKNYKPVIRPTFKCIKCNKSYKLSKLSKDHHHYKKCSKCFRVDKQRYRLAIKKGHNVNLECYLNDTTGFIKFYKSKPKKYYYARQFLDRAFATPKWVDKEKICEFYANCPEGHQVDHIIPINGNNVSGLHVVWNLQYLSLKDHIKKTKEQRKIRLKRN